MRYFIQVDTFINENHKSAISHSSYKCCPELKKIIPIFIVDYHGDAKAESLSCLGLGRKFPAKPTQAGAFMLVVSVSICTIILGYHFGKVKSSYKGFHITQFGKNTCIELFSELPAVRVNSRRSYIRLDRGYPFRNYFRQGSAVRRRF